MGDEYPSADTNELCLHLMPARSCGNEDEHHSHQSQSCEKALLTIGNLPYLLSSIP